MDWLQLARTPRIGPVTFFQLLARFGSAGSALKQLPSLARRPTGARIPPRSAIETEFQKTIEFGGQVLCASQPEFPPLLKQLAPPPPVLSVRGRVALFNTRSVAIVGARQASAVGRKLARDMAAKLSHEGFAIVSGLARGIDGEAHAASLSGGTIAVLGGGIDHIYPPQHRDLYEGISDTGLIVSESPFGHRATAKDFPRRNRIITGLSEGVVVIEAAERSGSLISARTALEQNREVMAVPGSPLEPRSAGSNRLLRDGAILVRDADDVMEALSSVLPRTIQAPPPAYYDDLDDQHPIPSSQVEAVRLTLGPHPAAIDEIARAADIGSARCAAILVELEIAGEAVTYSGGYAALAL